MGLYRLSGLSEYKKRSLVMKKWNNVLLIGLSALVILFSIQSNRLSEKLAKAQTIEVKIDFTKVSAQDLSTLLQGLPNNEGVHVLINGKEKFIVIKVTEPSSLPNKTAPAPSTRPTS